MTCEDCGADCDPDTFWCRCSDDCEGVRRAERGDMFNRDEVDDVPSVRGDT